MERPSTTAVPGTPAQVSDATPPQGLALAGQRMGAAHAAAPSADGGALPRPSARPENRPAAGRPAHSRYGRLRTGRESRFLATGTARAAGLPLPAVWQGARWAGSTTAVAAGSFVMGVVALWAASWITRSSLAGTAVRWDTSWYYRISQLGYVRALPTTPTQYAALRAAFFPGLPLVEHAVHLLLGGPPAATTLSIGAVGLLASCLLLRALVSSEYGDEVAWRATVVFAFFPGAYVFVMGYSEALEIPLALLTLYALRRRWYLVAGLATAAATGTRLLGVALVVACAIAAVRELVDARRAGRVQWFRATTAIASPVIGLTGLGAYMVYLHEMTGSYTAFQTAERVGWYNTIDFVEPYRAWQEFAAHPLATPFVTINALGVVVVGACLVFLAVEAVRGARLEEAAYAAVLLLSWMFTSNTGAWFRFIESAFPVLVLLALRLGRRWYPAAACSGAFLLGILLVLFATSVSFSP